MARKEDEVRPNNALLEGKLIENFVSLQKVLTNLAVKLDSLSGQISKFLQLFEISAKSFAEKTSGGGEASEIQAGSPALANKIDALLEQNKTIARGLTLIEEKLRGNLRF